MSVENKGSYDLESYMNSDKHKTQNIQICHNTPKISEFLNK
jgi:hypothetical protein